MHTIGVMVELRYKAVVDALAADIRAGRLLPGTRLPTHRQLAAREGIALVTASRVYAELAAMGLVSGEQGRGTFVREIALPPGQAVDQQAAAGRADDHGAGGHGVRAGRDQHSRSNFGQASHRTGIPPASLAGRVTPGGG